MQLLKMIAVVTGLAACSNNMAAPPDAARMPNELVATAEFRQEGDSTRFVLFVKNTGTAPAELTLQGGCAIELKVGRDLVAPNAGSRLIYVCTDEQLIVSIAPGAAREWVMMRQIAIRDIQPVTVGIKTTSGKYLVKARRGP